MTTTPSHSKLQPKFYLLVFLVSIGFFMQGLDTTIINTALPAMAESLQENPLKMHGIVISYVLAVAACIPLSGWLADRSRPARSRAPWLRAPRRPPNRWRAG